MPSRKQNESEQSGILARVGKFLEVDGEKGSERDVKATKLLKKDHDKVRDLFKQYDELGERAHTEKKRIVDQVSRELEIHAKIEEEIFYPACLKGEDEEKKIVHESFEEHKIVKTLVAELGRMTPSDEQFEAKVTVLKESVDHHAKEEEDDLFPEAERSLGEDRLRELGARMKARKEELAGRQAPSPTRRRKAPSPRSSSPRSSARRTP
jgi:hemerythrin superfamily protein